MLSKNVCRAIKACVLVCGVCGCASEASAQLFGERSLGGPIQGRRNARAAAAPAAEAGTLQGNERFLRDNRSRNAFVGSDRRSLQGFVGSGQAIGVGRVQAATETLTPPPDPSRRLNRPYPKLTADQMYFPRLVFDAGEVSAENRSGAMFAKQATQISERLTKISGQPVAVLFADGRAVLRGRVASEAMAEKLAIIASFEPSVDAIENQLIVAP
jgi:hypothetical protein